MSSFITEELIWATICDRQEEVRRVRPHTEQRLPSEAASTPPPSKTAGRPSWLSLQPSLNR